jgi:ATP-binding cassette subfamily F protein 3
MIHVSNLEKSYGGQLLFDKVSFTIHPGERIGLVGRNGHGKTTLFRILLNREHPDAGEIRIPQGYTLGHLSQKIRFTEETVLREGCLALQSAEDGRDDTYKVKTILQGLGFTIHDCHRPPSELSGGYQVRLNLAKVLVAEPNLLLLDEPTNYLDIVSLRWLTRFLLNWKNELILITHDRDFMDRVTTHTMGIHRCRIRKIAGSTDKLYRQILQEEEVYEQTRVNDEKKRKEVEAFIRRFRAKATKAKAVQSRIKALEKEGPLEKLQTVETLEFSFPAASFSAKWPLQVNDLAFAFTPDEPPLIGGLSFRVGKKDRIGVIGKNGKGKTTLLNLLAGEITPTGGQVSHHPNLRIAYFGQTNIDRLDADKTVEEEIFGAHPGGNRKVARSLCGAMMFSGDQALKKVRVLSGGERSRVLLGKLLVRPANLLLLDEPTNHLDMESTESLLAALEAFPGAVLIVTHSEMILHALAERLVIFDAGKVTLFEGSYQDFLDRVGWEEEAHLCPGKEAPTEEPTNLSSRKEIRRRRAGIVAERSSVLGNLKKRITELEDSISLLENEEQKTSQALLTASQEGSGEEIQRLSKVLHNCREKLAHLLREWEQVTEAHEEKDREFEERLQF